MLSWGFAAEFIDLEGCDSIERSARYWLYWNELVEKEAQHRFRIEDLNPREMVKALDLPNSQVDYIATRLRGSTAADSSSSSSPASYFRTY